MSKNTFKKYVNKKMSQVLKLKDTILTLNKSIT